MDKSQEIVSTTVEQIKTLLTTDRVVGDAIQIGDATILPLVSIGFGFGGGSGENNEGKSGGGAGAGAGGGVKPVALVISDAKGIRVEPINPGLSSLATSVSEIVRTVMEQRSGTDK